MIATVVLALRIALAVALYAFLGWALLTLFQDLRQQGYKLAAQKKPGISIHAKIEGGKESHHHFSQNEITIGRDTNCDISIMDGTLSAHHARIAHHHGQWWLEDLSSTNGTFLNREKLNMPAVLITGDEFKCGNINFEILVEEVEENLPPLRPI